MDTSQLDATPASGATATSQPNLEADGFRRLERTPRQPRSRLDHVVLARGDVVRPVGIEERREHLDVPPPDAELELPAAVHLNSACGAELDAFQQPLRRAKA